MTVDPVALTVVWSGCPSRHTKAVHCVAGTPAALAAPVSIAAFAIFNAGPSGREPNRYFNGQHHVVPLGTRRLDDATFGAEKGWVILWSSTDMASVSPPLAAAAIDFAG
jgi:hypothetical protein